MRRFFKVHLVLLFAMAVFWIAPAGTQAQGLCASLFEQRSNTSENFYSRFEFDFRKAIDEFIAEVKPMRQTRPRVFDTVAQTFLDLGLSGQFTAAEFNTKYLDFMGRQVTAKIITKEDILKPALVFQNSAGEILIVSFGAQPPLGGEWKILSTLTRVQFFRVLKAGYFPIGSPKERDPNVGRPVMPHDLTGHLGAFVKDPTYMKQMKRFAEIISGQVKLEREFYTNGTFSSVGHLAEFFLERFKYVPPFLRNSLYSDLLLPKGMDPLANRSVNEMTLLLSVFDKKTTEQKIEELLKKLDIYVYRLGGVERDDSYQFADGKISSDPFLKELQNGWVKYRENSSSYKVEYTHYILAKLQTYLIDLSRYSVEEYVTELNAYYGPNADMMDVIRSHHFGSAHPRLLYIYPTKE